MAARTANSSARWPCTRPLRASFTMYWTCFSPMVTSLRNSRENMTCAPRRYRQGPEAPMSGAAPLPACKHQGPGFPLAAVLLREHALRIADLQRCEPANVSGHNPDCNTCCIGSSCGPRLLLLHQTYQPGLSPLAEHHAFGRLLLPLEPPCQVTYIGSHVGTTLHISL